MASANGSEVSSVAKVLKLSFKCEICKKPCNTLKSYLKHTRLHPPKELLKVWNGVRE